MSNKNTSIVYLAIVLSLVAYTLPWIMTPTTPLTLGAYDLAEWTSLHPSQPHTTPALVVSLLLRLQLVIITLIIALASYTDKLRLFAIVAIILLSIAQLPPLEFLTIATDNINYQQQLTLATISLVAGFLLTVFKPTRFVPFITVILVGIGIITAGAGVNQAQGLYIMSLQENSVSAGVIVLCVAYLMIAVIHVQHLNITLLFNTTQQTAGIKQGSR